MNESIGGDFRYSPCFSTVSDRYHHSAHLSLECSVCAIFGAPSLSFSLSFSVFQFNFGILENFCG